MIRTDSPPAVEAAPAEITADAGLSALRALTGLIWTAEALELADAMAALPEEGGEVRLPAETLDRLCGGMTPLPLTRGGAFEVLVGMATVLALASGREASLTRAYRLNQADARRGLGITRAGRDRAVPAPSIRSAAQ